MYDEIGNRLLASGNCLGVLASGLSPQMTANAVIEKYKSTLRPGIEPVVIVVNQTLDDDSSAMPTTTVSTMLSGETLNRDQLYVKGGVFGITSRVFLSDVLTQKLVPELINLVIIFDAHSIGDNANEIFAVRVLRERNPNAHLIVLSDKPHAVLSKTSLLVSEMFLSDIVVFPRFHEIVQKALKTELSLFQMNANLTVRQKELQQLILNIVDSTLIEIRKSVGEDFFMGGSIEKSSAMDLLRDKSWIFNFRRKVDPIWMKLSWTTRQIISDLSVFRKLLVLLEEYDAVSFLAFLQAQQDLSGQSAPWWLSTDAQRMIQLAQDRASVENMEVPPKWELIDSVLSSLLGAEMDGPIRIMVIAYDEHEKSQLEKFLENGKNKYLFEFLKNYFSNNKRDFSSVTVIEKKLDSISNEQSWSERRRLSGDLAFVFSCIQTTSEPDLVARLQDYDPHAVIMMQPNLSALRSLEILSFLRPPNSRKTAIYLFECEDAICESKFPELVMRENQAFDELIKSRKNLNFHSKNELGQIAKQRALALAGSSSRQGGSKRVKTVAELIRQTVLVDTRELRSALPFVLYKMNLDIVPSTLSIGDYILSRDICVERKSVTGNDLQQSLMSGRLYKQLVNMTHAYPWPFLLLEFSTGKSFQLQASETSSGEINPGSLMAQIISIILHFPTLRLVWSPSFLFTGNVFSKLKMGRGQPRSDGVSIHDPVNAQSGVMSKRAIEFLKACPGITAANLPHICKRVSSIKALLALKNDEIISLLGKRDGNVFLRFLDQNFN